jgi:hypothetical protein
MKAVKDIADSRKQLQIKIVQDQRVVTIHQRCDRINQYRFGEPR